MTEVPGSTTLSVYKATPQWAKWAYRIVFMVTTALAGWIAATHLIGDSVKFEVILALKFIDPIVYGVAQLIGVDIVQSTDTQTGVTTSTK